MLSHTTNASPSRRPLTWLMLAALAITSLAATLLAPAASAGAGINVTKSTNPGRTLYSSPNVQRLTTQQLAETPQKPVYVATRSTFAQAEDACLQASGTWTVKMEGGEKVGRCDYQVCKTQPGSYKLLKWRVFVLAVCEDAYFKFSASKGPHY